MLLAAAVTVSLAACAGTAGSNAGGKTEETSASVEASDETEESESTPKETPEQAVSDETESAENTPEQSVVKWNCGTSGNVLRGWSS